MNFDEEEVVAYTRSAIISVTALELPLLLKGGRSGAVGDMVRELRSSSVAINGALRSLRESGLVYVMPMEPVGINPLQRHWSVTPTS